MNPGQVPNQNLNQNPTPNQVPNQNLNQNQPQQPQVQQQPQQQQSYIYCPHCGMKHISNKLFCIYCGYNFQTQSGGIPQNGASQGVIPMQMVPGVPQMQPQQQVVEEKHGSGVGFLVLSLLAAVFGVPYVARFGVAWLLLGSFSTDKTLYMALVYACIGFIVATGAAVLSSFINLIAKGKILKKCITFVFICFLLGAFSPIIIQKTGINLSDIGQKEIEIEKDKVIYQDDQYIIRQASLKKGITKTTLVLDVNGNLPEIPTYVTGYRVNHCSMSSRNEYDSETKTLTITFDQTALNEYKIEEIKEIDVFLPIGSGKTPIKIKPYDYEETNNSKLFTRDQTLYQNSYFRIRYNDNYEYEPILIFESLIAEPYRVSIGSIDLDTKGYTQLGTTFDLYDYTITKYKISSYPCEQNMSYIKMQYSVEDSNHNVVESGMIDQSFDHYLIDTRKCQDTE